jgi:hypothetical protein
MKRRRSEKEQKKLADDARLLRWWKAWHREQRDEALTKYPNFAELFRMFANLQHVAPAQLVGYVRTIDWVAIDYNTRLIVLHEANTAITRYREKCGHQEDPIDDALPGEPLRAFQLIRKIITEFPAPRESRRPATAYQSG